MKNYEHTESKLIIIKSPQIKFADLGYIRHSNKALEIELFSAGQVVQKIAINHLVCVNAGCTSKKSFNQEYLNASYPDDLLQNVFLGKEIYSGKNRIQTKNGFSQSIENENVNIVYKVSINEIFFKDKEQHILLKIKDIHGNK